mmetsp:Transcript_64049/g.187401  ORF Transcript_64049/g.187401 Transcript_64049/m.187401 type:complete len:262 (-) Transcript_64049:556-1341(-)
MDWKRVNIDTSSDLQNSCRPASKAASGLPKEMWSTTLWVSATPTMYMMIVRRASAQTRDFRVTAMEYTRVRRLFTSRMSRCTRSARTSRARRMIRTVRMLPAFMLSSCTIRLGRIVSMTNSKIEASTISKSSHAQPLLRPQKSLLSPVPAMRRSSSMMNSRVKQLWMYRKAGCSALPRFLAECCVCTPMTTVLATTQPIQKSSKVWLLTSRCSCVPPTAATTPPCSLMFRAMKIRFSFVFRSTLLARSSESLMLTLHLDLP